MIAEGWVERVEIGPEPAGFGSFHPVQVTMRVVRSLKGDAPSPLVFTDNSSYFADPGGGPNGFWAGSSGACGVLDADPTGQYALIVFRRHEGELGTALFMGAVFPRPARRSDRRPVPRLPRIEARDRRSAAHRASAG